MQTPAWHPQPHDRPRLRIEIAAAEPRLPVAGLDETLAVPVEPFGGALTGDPVGDVLRDDLGFPMREDARLREWLAER